MADNTTLPGTGDIIADEDVAGVKYQKMKLVDGKPGSVVPVRVTSDGALVVALDDGEPNNDGASAPVNDSLVHADLSPQSNDDPSVNAESLYDVLDSTNANTPLLGVSLLGSIDSAGQQPASNSVPVVLPLEQVLDLNVSAVMPVGSVGKNALSLTGAWTDCSQFRSISFQSTTSATQSVTLIFEGSNDAANAVAMPLYDSAAPTTAPVTTIAQLASTTRFWEGPLKFRYFRARISVAVAGAPMVFFTRLSMAPWSPSTTQVTATNLSSNVAQLAGSAPVTAGVAGTLAVGGNIAPGVAPTLQPLTTGGVDSTGKVRRFLTDASGNAMATMLVPDPALSLNFNSLRVKLVEADNAVGFSEREMLYAVLLELRALTLYIKELPGTLNAGNSFRDEPGDFAYDPQTLS